MQTTGIFEQGGWRIVSLMTQDVYDKSQLLIAGGITLFYIKSCTQAASYDKQN